MKPEQFMYLYIFVLAQRGGVGKSFFTQLVHSLLAMLALRIIVLDADVGNSSTATLYGSARPVDLQATTARGTVLRAIDELKSEVAHTVLMDVGAGKQNEMVDLLGRASVAAKAAGVRLVWVHPITSCNYVQVEATRAVETAKKLGIALVWARQLGQGHKRSDYRYWEKSKGRASGLSYAVECEIQNADRFLVDNAASLGLSLDDVARGHFEGLEDTDRALAEQLFDLDVQCFAADYLAEATDALGLAITEAVARAAAFEKKSK
ncbi:MAG: hypothetical protein U1E28_02125 [Beijerinckiaceae bacterium]